MSDMKLIMESWRKLLKEEEHRQQILEYLKENNITLTEEELEEAMPKWLTRLGSGAALGATLMGAPAAAQAADVDAPPEEPVATQQAAAEASSMDVAEAQGLLAWIHLFIQNRAEKAGSGREGVAARAETAQQFMDIQKALKEVADGDPSALMRLSGTDAELLQVFQKSFDKISAAEKAEAVEMGQSIQVR